MELTQNVGLHSGFPVTIFASGSQSLTGQGGGNVRPNRYRPLRPASRTVDRWVGESPAFCAGYGVDDGVCAYGPPAPGSFGSAGVGTERTPVALQCLSTGMSPGEIG